MRFLIVEGNKERRHYKAELTVLYKDNVKNPEGYADRLLAAIEKSYVLGALIERSGNATKPLEVEVIARAPIFKKELRWRMIEEKACVEVGL